MCRSWIRDSGRDTGGDARDYIFDAIEKKEEALVFVCLVKKDFS
jgi:hypothetical protein